MFRLSAPRIGVEGKDSESGNSTTSEKEVNGVKTPADERVNGDTHAAPSTMLPPRGGGASNQNSAPKQSNGRGRESVAVQPKMAAGGRKVSLGSTPAQVASEEEAMLAANLPSSFGAARDKPLGKKANRTPELVRGGAGAGLSGSSGRFFTAGTATGTAGVEEGSAPSKGEARRRREAEIAAMTAELSRADDSEDGGAEKEVAERFTPGGWRHAKGADRREAAAARHSGAPLGGRPQREEDEEGDGEEEDPMEEDSEEEEEEITDDMRIRQVVRRLGLPVSHEVQLSGHNKGVTALALDRAGGRVATGSNDYKVCGTY